MPITLGDKRLGSVASPTTALHLESSSSEADRSIRLSFDGTFYSEMRQLGAAGMAFRNNSTTDLVTINGSGHVTMPFQPAFHAVLNGPQTMVNNSDFVFGTAFLNRGSHYSTTTGRFTAPVTGVYFIYFEGLLQNNERDQIDIRFFINGNQSQVATMFQVDYGGTYRKIQMTAIVSLSTNDYIAVRTQSPNNYDFYGETNATILSNSGSGHTGFKGFLIG